MSAPPTAIADRDLGAVGGRDEIRVVSPPWPVQRVAFAVLAPLARLRGYSAA